MTTRSRGSIHVQKPEPSPKRKGSNAPGDEASRCVAPGQGSTTRNPNDAPNAGVERKVATILEDGPRATTEDPTTTNRTDDGTRNWGKDEAAIIRAMIVHENDLTNHRMTWLVTLHGLLFASLGFAWKDGKELVPLISGLGILTSYSIRIHLKLADHAIKTLVARWDQFGKDDYTGPDVIGLRAMHGLSREDIKRRNIPKRPSG